MSDKELLELAATAYGDLVYVPDMGWIAQDEHGNRGAWWNPFGDDGDALRLAVKLGLCVMTPTKNSSECLVIDEDVELMIEETQDDYYASTRRAIVRAAAEIGKGIK